MSQITIAKDIPAVDAYILSKGEAVSAYADAFNIPLGNMAAIADSVKDLSFLLTEGLGFVGAPANAQDQVKKAVRDIGGHVSDLEVYDAFEEFYALASQRGITHIVSDRDGVLKDGANTEGAERFKRLTRNMGNNGKPFVAVLTGSSFGQNLNFLRQFGLDESLSSNPAVREHPFLLAAENGAIHYNVLTGDTINYCNTLDANLLTRLKGEFEEYLISSIEDFILPRFDLYWSIDYNDQRGKVYMPDKQSMVTVNIPREFPDGTKNYRKSPQADNLRQAIFDAMEDSAAALDIKYKVIES